MLFVDRASLICGSILIRNSIEDLRLLYYLNNDNIHT